MHHSHRLSQLELRPHRDWRSAHHILRPPSTNLSFKRLTLDPCPGSYGPCTLLRPALLSQQHGTSAQRSPPALRREPALAAWPRCLFAISRPSWWQPSLCHALPPTLQGACAEARPCEEKHALLPRTYLRQHARPRSLRLLAPQQAHDSPAAALNHRQGRHCKELGLHSRHWGVRLNCDHLGLQAGTFEIKSVLLGGWVLGWLSGGGWGA